MLIRRETRSDIDAVRTVTSAAFAKSDTSDTLSSPSPPPPVEATLLDELRISDGWLPALSFVATGDRGEVIGHVVCTRGHVGSDLALALGLGPLSVHPAHQGRGVGLALVHAVLGAADAFGESLVALLGSPAYYGRFGFRPATEYGISAPDPAWGEYFQVRTLTAYQPTVKGPFRYAEPFDRV
ncbi:GNAT family N-acetyltransferase [Streptomyces rapamycinicus]|uniref:Acetyltransferase n=2 Tax=Streptomyces rapamycinicus TaxID=1226757 RepID=A0A0A0NTC1_STRRN|nr:N-acetyltransferase [Streptomyces rapamycinicus]AGP57930.1 acetyltransferase [Streptomyces rapamycinicus NRRL 5491]MBB4785600.1 putative acetyltransferase [Streptomyces rapamycinicus]RLV78935.1 acetyltransferase [Streptomyces rapamycinicus NRRL 5491]UTO65770.1 N-acetyltransferase [Streptomyces rapamycinicus]UTP33727.1 N-acetyltransferase [Streptomyces rapamycinicus NRRL 5491]